MSMIWFNFVNIGKYLAVCIVLSGINIVFTALMLWLASKQREIPVWIVNILRRLFSKGKEKETEKKKETLEIRANSVLEDIENVLVERLAKSRNLSNLFDSKSLNSPEGMSDGEVNEAMLRNPVFLFPENMIESENRSVKSEDVRLEMDASRGNQSSVNETEEVVVSKTSHVLLNLMKPIPDLCLEYLAMKEISRAEEQSGEEPTEDMENLIWLLNLVFGVVCVLVNVLVFIFLVLYMFGILGDI